VAIALTVGSYARPSQATPGDSAVDAENDPLRPRPRLPVLDKGRAGWGSDVMGNGLGLRGGHD